MEEIWRYKNVNQELPVLALRGEEDVSTGLEKGSNKSIKNFGISRIWQYNTNSLP